MLLQLDVSTAADVTSNQGRRRMQKLSTVHKMKNRPWKH